MGITGLLPFLEKSSKPINVSEYSGCTVAVDTYCWLHKGAFSCAEKLARGEQTDQFVVYCMKFVNMLLSHNIKPILVFDGRHLPAKAETEKVRKERREMNRKKAAELLRAERLEEARNLIRRCVDVTHEMASALLSRCHSAGVDCIVAPYEADAQLAFFSISGVAHLVITEDSDLLLFGCKKVLFKMDLYGNGVLVDQSLIPLAMKQPADQFSLEKFRYMCVLSGCDYLPSLPGIGLAKACKFIKRTADDNIHRALSRLGSYLNMNNLVVSEEYKNNFMVAISMFKYQPVFDPFQRILTTLTPLPEGERMPVDEGLTGDIYMQLALGNLNPFTLARTANWDPDDPKNFRTAGWNAGTINNSIWSKEYQPRKKMQKKSAQTCDKFVSRVEKLQCKTVRKSSIKIVPSPKKTNIEEEINNLRNLYSIKSPTLQQTSCLEMDEEEDSDLNVTMCLNNENGDLFGDDDDTFNEMAAKTEKISNSRNPFAKNSITDKKVEMTPLCGALTKMSKISTPSNEMREVSRYFCSDYAKDETLKETPSTQTATSNPTIDDDILKDIINSPSKLKLHEAKVTEPVTTPTIKRRNIFSKSPNTDNNSKTTLSISTNKVVSGRPSLLGMLDSMVSPKQDKRSSNSTVPEKTPASKKQVQLSFPDNLASPCSTVANAEDSENKKFLDGENVEPLKAISSVKAQTRTSINNVQTKVEKPTFLKMTTPKMLNNQKLGPAKTVGLKRKKSTNSDNSKHCQPSIFDMFSFQPKAKLKMQ